MQVEKGGPFSITKKTVTIVGAGLAGCEAALTLAKKGIKVLLYECKPLKKSEAHKSNNFCELVCSNSLKSLEPSTSQGLLKKELQLLSSSVLEIAHKALVPAGSALAVDRERFSSLVTAAIRGEKNIQVINEVVKDINPNCFSIIATGPLTVGDLAESIKEKFQGRLFFFDAAAPIIDAESVDMENAFIASRYQKGDADYINCPLEKDEYYNFVNALINAKTAPLKDFEKDGKVFSGCMPIEVMAKKGVDSLRFGPLKPVGFINPKTEKRPFAVVQLRKENTQGNAYNIVGFQTNLTISSQKEVFSKIPALKNLSILRYGVMHKNTYINAPLVINKNLQVKNMPKTFIAGQLSGVEGYVESIASGLISAINIERLINKKPFILLPQETILGSLLSYLEAPNKNFQPMNANFGLLPPLQKRIKDKKEKGLEYFRRSTEALEAEIASLNISTP